MARGSPCGRPPARPWAGPARPGLSNPARRRSEGLRCLGFASPLARSALLGLQPPPPPPLLSRFRSGAMSRGTRRGDDVWWLTRATPYTPPQSPPSYSDSYPDPDPDTIPYPQVSYPEGYDLGTGRLHIIRTNLLATYNSIAKNDAMVQTLQELGWKTFFLKLKDKRQKKMEEAQSTRDRALNAAICRIGEMEAIGHEAYIPKCFEGRVHSPGLVPFGSMAYLAKAPHYFSPEKYAIPIGLPSGDEKVNSPDDIKTVGDANIYLRKRYNMMVTFINTIRFFRDHRIRNGYLLSPQVPFNFLSGQIEACRTLIDQVLAILQKFAHQDGLFTIPKELRTCLFKDYNFISPYVDYSVLFCSPQPVIPSCAYYVFFENTCGYYLFHANGFDNCADCCDEQSLSRARASLLKMETFCSIVQLIVFFPFPPDKQGPFLLENQESVPAMLQSFLLLNLPDPTIYKHYTLGVLDDRLCFNIPRAIGIPCKNNEFFLILERGIRIYLEHLLMWGH